MIRKITFAIFLVLGLSHCNVSPSLEPASGVVKLSEQQQQDILIASRAITKWSSILKTRRKTYPNLKSSMLSSAEFKATFPSAIDDPILRNKVVGIMNLPRMNDLISSLDQAISSSHSGRQNDAYWDYIVLGYDEVISPAIMTTYNEFNQRMLNAADNYFAITNQYAMDANNLNSAIQAAIDNFIPIVESSPKLTSDEKYEVLTSIGIARESMLSSIVDMLDDFYYPNLRTNNFWTSLKRIIGSLIVHTVIGAGVGYLVGLSVGAPHVGAVTGAGVGLGVGIVKAFQGDCLDRLTTNSIGYVAC